MPLSQYEWATIILAVIAINVQWLIAIMMIATTIIVWWLGRKK
jgi:hypothetical protein